MARCPHNRTQQFTHYCLDCGRNEYESDEDYLKWLRAEKKRRAGANSEIERLERELGIKHPGNTPEPDSSEPADPCHYDI